MKCINCSAELTNEKFCPYCGTKVVNMNIKEEKKEYKKKLIKKWHK